MRNSPIATDGDQGRAGARTYPVDGADDTAPRPVVHEAKKIRACLKAGADSVRLGLEEAADVPPRRNTSDLVIPGSGNLGRRVGRGGPVVGRDGDRF
ncbi:hypothetical protein, partial [Kitasatospora sp. NPDC050463]|uniref:hypothetical protein n=1 Tax=Kitasatospora sp. NPDC050463 TaxID=3155786 RepID=UPI0033E94BC5